MATKTCKQCGKERDVGSFQKAGKYRVHTCNVCKNKRRAERRANEPEYREVELVRAAIARLDPANQEKNRARTERFREENPEYVEGWREANAEGVYEYHRDRWEGFKRDHVEELGEDCPCWWCYHRAVSDLWAEGNPLKRAAIAANRRARLRNAPSDGSMTPDVWASMRMGAPHCVTCGLEFKDRGDRTQGHVVPISVGGHHSTGNVIVQCHLCNCRQGTRILGEWTPPRALDLVVADLLTGGVKIPVPLSRALARAT